jgi:methyl-accepting chemotaxis protein
MAVFNNLKISQKIIALLLMLGGVTVVIAWIGSQRLTQTSSSYGQLVSVELPNNTNFVRVNRSLTAMLYASYQTLSYDGAGSQARKAAEQEAASYAKAVSRLQEIAALEPAAGGVVTRLREGVDGIHALTGTAIRLGLKGQTDEARRLLVDADLRAKSLIDDNVRLQDRRIAASRRMSDELTAAAASTSRFMFVIGIVGVVAGIAIALAVSRVGIIRPLDRLRGQMGEIAGGDYRQAVTGMDRRDEIGQMAGAVQVFRENGIAKDAADADRARANAEQKMVVDTVSSHLSELSAGDLTATIDTEFPGEYAVLKSNFNDALAKLRELIGSVSESATAIRTGSGEIAQASEDLARRTESNAASLEETAASVTQMDGRLRASAAAATRTVERADQAIATVGGGRAVADEAVQAMGRVSDSAKGIDSVIEGLDKIAFQTRVLAMNAAVEAGRAGDAGRGFAVVADLVSALAMRAEEEAKRARDQLTVTQTDIVTAVEAVTKVDGALANISGDVAQVHELLATMAADNQAQSAAITQISAAIGTMDQSTQQNAAMVEETSAAARNLAGEVSNLTDQTGLFRIGRQAARPLAGSNNRVNYAKPAAYASPVRPLPADAIPALVRSDSDWTSF